MERYVIAGNWKMNMVKDEAKTFFKDLSSLTKNKGKKITKIICPVSPLLSFAIEESKDLDINIGAQNVSEHDKGAFTGEVSASILGSIDVKYCIIGHSERRQFFGDTDDKIKQKWLLLRTAKIAPIICVGETLVERDNGRTFDVIRMQIEGIFKGVELVANEDLLVAYEPVLAIGTGKTATPEMAQEVHAHIRELLAKLYSDKANSIPLLYGGSVKSSNIKELLAQKDINGALVGGASLLADEYAKMINIAEEML